jgi:hypothetical protein
VPVRGGGVVGGWGASVAPSRSTRAARRSSSLATGLASPPWRRSPRIGNAERENVTPQRRRWLTGELALPEYTQFGARQLFQVFNRDIHIAVVKHRGSSQWPGGIAASPRACVVRPIASRSGAEPFIPVTPPCGTEGRPPRHRTRLRSAFATCQPCPPAAGRAETRPPRSRQSPVRASPAQRQVEPDHTELLNLVHNCCFPLPPCV